MFWHPTYIGTEMWNPVDVTALTVPCVARIPVIPDTDTGNDTSISNGLAVADWRVPPMAINGFINVPHPVTRIEPVRR